MTTIGDLVVADEGWILVLYEDRRSAAAAWQRSPLFKGAGYLYRWWGEGMHHRAVEKNWRMLEARDHGKRRFVKTQNPNVVDLMTFESTEDVRGRVLAVRDVDGVPTVENITESEASQVWNAYEAGIEHVSEILRTRDLW